MDTITVTCDDLRGIATLKLPGWPGEYRVEAREDGGTGLIVEVPQRFEGETWRLILLTGGILCSIVTSTSRKRPVPRVAADEGLPPMVVKLPPELIEHIQVETDLPGR